MRLLLALQTPEAVVEAVFIPVVMVKQAVQVS